MTVPGAGAVTAADFNGDGRPDLASARYGAGEIVISLRNAANNGFVSGGSVPAGTNPRFISAADFNADGRPDLAVSNIGSNSLTVLLRNAANTGFVQEAGSPITVGLKPIALVTTDLTGDGLPDIAVVNSASDSVTVLNRLASGGFAPAGAPIPVGDDPYGIAAADFDRDGRVDLVTANHASNNVTILMRQENGSYAPDAASPIPTGLGADQVAAADFNGDGRPDLAITNDGATNVTVLLNTTPDPVTTTPPPTDTTPVVTPQPVPQPVNTTPAPRISARLVLSWSVFRNYVRLDSATLKDLPVGATVKVSCSTCKTKSTTLTAKKTTLSLTKLRSAKLKRGKSFTVTITKPGSVGQSMSRRVKNYGRTLKAMKKAVKAPFSESRACIPVGAATPAKTC